MIDVILLDCLMGVYSNGGCGIRKKKYGYLILLNFIVDDYIIDIFICNVYFGG